MAARSNKIFGEILFKQYKYKPKIISPISLNVRHLSQNLTKDATTPFRKASVRVNEIIRNSKLNKEIEDHYLQPALLPTFVGHQNKRNERCHMKCISTQPLFNEVPKGPKVIYTIPKNKNSIVALSSIKFPLKLTHNRQYSTLLSSTRHYSASKNWGNQTEGEKCDTKRECFKGCPKWQMTNCPPQGDNLECKRPYLDPCCKKKPAPYPSYSETCAERLDDDPSECMQCPWDRCGGADSLKYPKRRYHTTTAGNYYRFKKIALPLLKITEVNNPSSKYPPSKCDDVKCKKCNKQSHKGYKWTQSYRMWADKNDIVPLKEQEENIALTGSPSVKVASPSGVDDNCTGEKVTTDDCCLKIPFDKRQMDYDHIRKRQCHKSTCRKKKQKRVPDGCDGTCKKCMNPNLFEIFYDCQRKKKKCPRGECERRICPDRDKRIDKRYRPSDPCCEKVKKELAKRRRPKPKIFVPDPPDHDGI